MRYRDHASDVATRRRTPQGKGALKNLLGCLLVIFV